MKAQEVILKIIHGNRHLTELELWTLVQEIRDLEGKLYEQRSGRTDESRSNQQDCAPVRDRPVRFDGVV